MEDRLNAQRREEIFRELMVNADRTVIRARISAVMEKIRLDAVTWQESLNVQGADFKEKTNEIYLNSLTHGLQGETGDAAKRFLEEDLKSPKLKSPVKQ